MAKKEKEQLTSEALAAILKTKAQFTIAGKDNYIKVKLPLEKDKE